MNFTNSLKIFNALLDNGIQNFSFCVKSCLSNKCCKKMDWELVKINILVPHEIKHIFVLFSNWYLLPYVNHIKQNENLKQVK